MPASAGPSYQTPEPLLAACLPTPPCSAPHPLPAGVSTLGSVSCYCLSWLLGRQLAHALWPGRLERFGAEVAARRGDMFNYIVFLRVTPILPNIFINVAAPVVGVPLGPFALGAAALRGEGGRDEKGEMDVRASHRRGVAMSYWGMAMGVGGCRDPGSSLCVACHWPVAGSHARLPRGLFSCFARLHPAPCCPARSRPEQAPCWACCPTTLLQ